MTELVALVLFITTGSVLFLLFRSHEREALLREEISRWQAFTAAMRGDAGND